MITRKKVTFLEEGCLHNVIHCNIVCYIAKYIIANMDAYAAGNETLNVFVSRPHVGVAARAIVTQRFQLTQATFPFAKEHLGNFDSGPG